MSKAPTSDGTHAAGGAPQPDAGGEMQAFFHSENELEALLDPLAAEKRAAEARASLGGDEQQRAALADLRAAQDEAAAKAEETAALRPVAVTSERAEHHDAVVPPKIGAAAPLPAAKQAIEVNAPPAPPVTGASGDETPLNDPALAVDAEPLKQLPEAKSRNDKTALDMRRQRVVNEASAAARAKELYKDAPRSIYNTAKLSVTEAPVVAPRAGSRAEAHGGRRVRTFLFVAVAAALLALALFAWSRGRDERGASPAPSTGAAAPSTATNATADPPPAGTSASVTASEAPPDESATASAAKPSGSASATTARSSGSMVSRSVPAPGTAVSGASSEASSGTPVSSRTMIGTTSSTDPYGSYREP